MSAPPFSLAYTAEASSIIKDLAEPKYADKQKLVKKTLRLLRDIGPSHPGLNSHTYHSISGPMSRRRVGVVCGEPNTGHVANPVDLGTRI